MSSLRSADYRWWLVSDSSGVVGASLRGFAVPLVVYLLSGSVVWAGAVGTTAAVITVLLSLLGESSSTATTAADWWACTRPAAS